MGSTRHIPLSDAGPAVRDVMLAEPRTVSMRTSAAEVRETFAKPSVKLLLVAEGDRFVGTLARDDVPDGDGTIEAAVDTAAPHVTPDDPVTRALELLEHADRVPVVDEDGRLHGLVCLNRSRGAFCASPLE
jgi:CBS domain-containing protein